MLKGVSKYLQNTINQGKRFCQPKQLNHPDFQLLKWHNIPDDPLVSFDVNMNGPNLVEFVDAAHENELRKHGSTTGLIYIFFWRCYCLKIKNRINDC